MKILYVLLDMDSLKGFEPNFMDIKLQLLCENKCGFNQPVITLRKADELFKKNMLYCQKCKGTLQKL